MKCLKIAVAFGLIALSSSVFAKVTLIDSAQYQSDSGWYRSAAEAGIVRWSVADFRPISVGGVKSYTKGSISSPGGDLFVVVRSGNRAEQLQDLDELKQLILAVKNRQECYQDYGPALAISDKQNNNDCRFVKEWLKSKHEQLVRNSGKSKAMIDGVISDFVKEQVEGYKRLTILDVGSGDRFVLDLSQFSGSVDPATLSRKVARQLLDFDEAKFLQLLVQDKFQ